MPVRKYPAQAEICFAIQITTQTDKDKKKKSKLFYLFQYLKEKSAAIAQSFGLKCRQLQRLKKKSHSVKT